MGLRILGIIFSSIFAVGCGLIGFALTNPYINLPLFTNPKYGYPSSSHFGLIAAAMFVSLGVLLGFLLGSMLYRKLVETGKNLRRIPPEDKIASLIGTLISLLPAFFIGFLIVQAQNALGFSSIVVFAMIILETVLIVWLGNIVAFSMRDELRFLMPSRRAGVAETQSVPGRGKLLDTNVIIDGRIFDICRAGFIEGKLLIPGFVLEELQHIADSSDALRRNRGRRGLDILEQMQKEFPALHVLDRYKVTFTLSDGVDEKLVKLAKALDADIVTNDFNLNKVARLHGVHVLNINELANAVKPVVLPGEDMMVTIVREGKEFNQGVGYLDDGTMVVVEGGKKMMGETVHAVVASVLQTVAGKMIFTELREEENPGAGARGQGSGARGQGSGVRSPNSRMNGDD